MLYSYTSTSDLQVFLLATHLISNRSKQFDVFRDELPTPKRTKLANLQILNETDNGESKSAKESAEKCQNEEKKASSMKTKATSIEENHHLNRLFFVKRP